MSNILHILVIWGKIHSSIKWIANQEKFGVLQMGEIFPK